MRAFKKRAGGRLKAGRNKASRPKRFKKAKSGSTQDKQPKKWPPWAVLAGIGSFALWGWAVYKIQRDGEVKHYNDEVANRNSKVKDSSNKVINRNSDANREVLKALLLKPLVYTEHATCRMDCR